MLYWKDKVKKNCDFIRGLYRYPQKMLGRSIGELQPTTATTVVVAAHPDDETLGIGGLICQEVNQGKNIVIIFATNGCRGLPEPMSIHERVAMRIEEARTALSLPGISPHNVSFLGFPDSESYRYMESLGHDLTRLLAMVHPTAVFVHGIEGGHIDHDVVSYVTQRICLRLGIDSVWEWAEYNPKYPLNSPVVAFMEGTSSAGKTFELNEAVLRLKARMISCYESQKLPSGCLRTTEVIRKADFHTALPRFLNSHKSDFWNKRLPPVTRKFERQITRFGKKIK